jgi:hypothetical protein
MNIFVLSEDPILAAQMQCDQHVIKMPLETAQMLCTAYPEDEAPYKYTHYNHPCNVWLREARENYEWLIVHGLALCEEYFYRYQKRHASEEIIFWCWAHMGKILFPNLSKTCWPIAMDEQFKQSGVVESYRNFYLKDKSRFARWAKNRPSPPWYVPSST